MSNNEYKIVTTHFEGASDEQIEVRTFDEDCEVARVKVVYGQTVNTGNFSSVRYDVAVELPCYPEELPAAFAEAKEICNSQAAAIRAKIREATGK